MSQLSAISPVAAGVSPVAAGVSSVASKQAAEQARAASMLEGMFLRELMKVMRETVPESSMFGDNLGQNIYTQMFDESVADEVSKGEGIGLRRVLLDQLGGGALPTGKLQAAFQPTPRRAASIMQQVARLGQGAPQPLSTTATRLGGLELEAPNRPEPIRLKDPDGRLAWPVREPSRLLDQQGSVATSAGAEVLAAGSGQVVAADSSSLTVEHAGGLRTRYTGLGKVQAQVGDLVLRGQTLGAVGRGGSFQFHTERSGRELQLPEIASLMGPKV